MNRKHKLIYAMLLVIAFAAAQIYTVCFKCVDCFSLADSEEKCIYLTFDDGPSDRVTPKILDILKEENVKATFFIVGQRAETRKYLIKREHDEGHCVAIHSYSHQYKDIYSSPQALIKDIDECNDLIEEITGERSKIYRFPGGSFTVEADFIAHVRAHGLTYVDWNASTRDAELYNPTSADLLKEAIKTPVYPKRIVMLSHDTTDKTVVADALQDIIRYYKNKGYVFKKF
ncbi:MAG: polysaccharide deacetylase family protein [Candidatus Coproplasma sp.]